MMPLIFLPDSSVSPLRYSLSSGARAGGDKTDALEGIKRFPHPRGIRSEGVCTLLNCKYEKQLVLLNSLLGFIKKGGGYDMGVILIWGELLD